jgi:hypothetical protein
MSRATHPRRDPRQMIKEAYQIARDHSLRIKETPTTKGVEFTVYRIVSGRPIYLGKRSSPAAIRRFVAHAADFH